MSKESTLILEELKKFCVDKINDMKSNPNKGQYGSGCIDAWSEVEGKIDELLHPEMYDEPEEETVSNTKKFKRKSCWHHRYGKKVFNDVLKASNEDGKKCYVVKIYRKCSRCGKERVELILPAPVWDNNEKVKTDIL